MNNQKIAVILVIALSLLSTASFTNSPSQPTGSFLTSEVSTQNNTSFVKPSKYVVIASGGCDLEYIASGYDDVFFVKDESTKKEEYELYKVLFNSKLTMVERGKSLINHLNLFDDIFNRLIYEDDGKNYIKFGQTAGKSVSISWSLDTNGDETMTSSTIGSGVVNGSKYWIFSHPGSNLPIVAGEATGLVGKETKGCDYYVFIPRANMVFLYMIAKRYSQVPFINGHEYVDLGLSVKWATCNVDAAEPWEYGGYYQWAGTKDVASTRIYLYWSNCPCHSGSSFSSGFTKYVTSNSPSFGSGSGVPDDKTVLDPGDDVAHVKLGGSWRMPTDAEWRELMENCTWTWTTVNGVKGQRVTSKKAGYTDKSIFLPTAGSRKMDELQDAGSIGHYWSSSLYPYGYPPAAECLEFNSGDVYRIDDFRYCGLSVRPVCP